MPQDANRQSSQTSSASASSALALYSSGSGSHESAIDRSGAGDSAPAASIVKRIDSTALEASANQLVDEVFEDIDYLLDGTTPIHAVPQAAGAQGSSFTTNVFIPPAAEGSSTALNSMVMLWGLFPAIVGGLCLGLFLAFGIIISGRQVAAPPGASEADTTTAASPEDADFLAYLDQALDGIDPQLDSAVPSVAKRPASGTAKSSSALAATSFAGANPLLLTPPVNVPTATAPPLLPAIPIQTAPVRLSAPPPAAPVPTAPQPLAPQPSPSAPSSSPVATASAPNPSAPDPEAAPKNEIIPNISPSPHVLVGLLQLGDRSAAIFEFDDGARRVRIGDAIGSSGWSLVSISQDEAVIRRNGEVRSIYIGQRI